jgi:anti-sigma B factor antagonist
MVAHEPISPLRMSVQHQMPWAVVHLTGELDWISHAAFEDCLFEIVDESEQPHICIDLSDLEFCDTSGVACIMRAWRAATRKGGTVVLLGADEQLSLRLVLLGLDGTLVVVDRVPDSIAAVMEPAATSGTGA